MYEITSLLYLKVAEALGDAIGNKDFFSGSVTVSDSNVDCRLVCTLVVSRESVSEDMGSGTRIIRLSPVWWEFHTSEGAELFDNDFSFSTMLTYFY